MPSAIANATEQNDQSAKAASNPSHQNVVPKSVEKKPKHTVSEIPLTDITLIETVGLIEDTGLMLQDTDHQTPSKQIRTTCPYCGVGCGVLATVNSSSGVITVQGDPQHPANFGKLCSKGSNLAHTLGTQRRLTQPYYQNKHLSMQSGYGALVDAAHNDKLSQDNETVTQPALWDDVLDDVAARLNDTIEKHGRDSVMFYVSGQLLTEDYYVANKFIKGFIGNNNIDSNSRLCMSSAVAGHKRAFGADLVTGSYTDLENCDLLVLVGANMAWCHPILFGRFLKAKEKDPSKKLIVIDPRRTDSCEFADLHLPIAPGTDTHLYNGLLNYLNKGGYQDETFVSQTQGLEAALTAANAWDIDAVAKATTLDTDTIEAFYQLFADNKKTVTAFSMGVNQSSSGTDKVNAITNTHLFTGRVGKEGANPFSLTGQPNAMGGREVGALANLLAAHLDLNNESHRKTVADFWQSPQPINSNVGVKACEAADAILEGRIKAIWIMATNPVVSLPEADKFRRALAECDLVIVSECSKDSDTIRCADIVLPAQGWAEKSGTVTNSERRISRQRQLLPAVEESKPDWWIMSQVAQRMGLDGFDYQHPSDIFNEHSALTGFKNSETINNCETSNNVISPDSIPRFLNLANTLSNRDSLLTREQYDALEPFQWGGKQIDVLDKNYPHEAPQFIAVTPPKNAGSVNAYGSKDGFIDSTKQVKEQALDSAQNAMPETNLRLITGRLRDQWHTMTRTALAPMLNQQQPVPMVTLHPEDAKSLGLKANDYIKLTPKMVMSSDTKPNAIKASEVVVQLQIGDDMRQGDAFMPMHWSEAFATLARVGSLVPTKVDPISGQPELKNSAVTASPVMMHSVGQIMIQPELQDALVTVLRDLAYEQPQSEDLLEEDTDLVKSVDSANQIQQQASQSAITPNFLYTLSRQENSLLISLATPSTFVAAKWNLATFWQQVIRRMVAYISGPSREPIKSHVDKNAALLSSVMLNETQKQLRFVVQGSIKELFKEDALQTDLNTEPTDESNAQSLLFAVYIAPSHASLPSTRWLDSCFADMSLVPSVKWLLAGRPASGYIDPGPLVCSCMSVHKNTIIDAVVNHDCHDAAAVGECTKAGTNCGSCVGQINTIIAETDLVEA